MSDNKLPLVLTLDAGGTNFVFSAIRDFEHVGKEITKSAYHENLRDTIATLLNGFHEVLSSVSEKPQAISFAFPGPADYNEGIIGDLFNLHTFRGGVPLKNIIEDKFKIPVFINNDGDLFVLGEAEKGLLPFFNKELVASNSIKKFKNLFGVTLGTGFGGGCVIDNRLMLGDNSSASEIWLFSNNVLPEYNAETSISIGAIKRDYADHAKLSLVDVPEPETIYKIAKGEAAGNKDAANMAFQTMGKVLGNVLANVVTVVDGLIVIGGGLSGAYDIFIGPLLNEMKKNYKQINDNNIPRLPFEIYDLENTREFNKFLIDDIVEVKHSTGNIFYDRHKRIGIGKSKLGTNKAVSIGAYKFAIQQLQKY